MSSQLVEALIPIVSILAVFGMPVAIVFVAKFFKLKEKEIALEGEAQRWAEKQSAQLEARVQRLESVLMSLDQDLRTRLSRPLLQQPARPELMEGPPALPLADEATGAAQALADDATRAAQTGKTRF